MFDLADLLIIENIFMGGETHVINDASIKQFKEVYEDVNCM